jgi:hypothetical protein
MSRNRSWMIPHHFWFTHIIYGYFESNEVRGYQLIQYYSWTFKPYGKSSFVPIVIQNSWYMRIFQPLLDASTALTFFYSCIHFNYLQFLSISGSRLWSGSCQYPIHCSQEMHLCLFYYWYYCYYGAILASYWENLAELSGESYASCREPRSDSYISTL